MAHNLQNNLVGLTRGRYIVAFVGMALVAWKPEVGSWVVALAGFAIGTSAIDAAKGGSKDGAKSDS